MMSTQKKRKTAPSRSMPSSSISKSEQARYQAEDDVRVLQRAAEIERDKKRLAAAKKMAQEQADNLKRITAKGGK